MRDILYLQLRKQKTDISESISNKTELQMIHKKWSPVDYKLYQYFNTKLDQMVKAQPNDFTEEVLQYKVVQKLVNEFCERHCQHIVMWHKECSFAQHIEYIRNTNFTVEPSKWNPKLIFTVEDCILMYLNHDNIRDFVESKHKICSRNETCSSDKLYGVLPWTGLCKHRFTSSFLGCE
jgi:ribosomal protein S18